MSQTASDESRTTSDQSRNASDRRDTEGDGNAEEAETPEIEEDLISEELRIDGICGVY